MKPVCEVDMYGIKWWYVNEKLHREDGPAIEWPDGEQRWFLNGILHREDGPAVVYPDGKKYWYVNGKCVRVYVGTK
jgi:hypothetical protein